MLKNYSKYLNDDVLNENHVKPDPAGSKKLYDTKSYSTEFSKTLTNTVAESTSEIDKKLAVMKKEVAALEKSKIDAAEKAKKSAVEIMVEKLKKDLVGKLICLYDENSRQKIIDIGDVIVGNKGTEYYPVFVDADDDKKKIRYYWENDGKSKLFNAGKFLEFFEEYYLDQLLMFQGRPVKGGEQMKYLKHVVRIGVHNGTTQDFIIVESDDKTSQLLVHNQPIKILDMRLKELDPHGEENWDD